MDDERLIEEVCKRSVLYDVGNPKYTNKDVTARAWEEVARELQCGVFQARKRWSYLRDYFRKQVREQAEEASTRKRPWFFYERMSFLIPHMKKIKPSSSFSDSPNQPMASSEFEEEGWFQEDDIDLKGSIIDASDPASPLCGATGAMLQALDHRPVSTPIDSVDTGGSHVPVTYYRRQMKRKVDNDDEVATECVKVLKDSESDDDDDGHFFKSCLPMVKRLSLEEKLEFRISVQQLLLKYMRRTEDRGDDA